MCNYEVHRLFLFNFVASSQDAYGHVWKNVSTVAKQNLVLGGVPLNALLRPSLARFRGQLMGRSLGD